MEALAPNSREQLEGVLTPYLLALHNLGILGPDGRLRQGITIEIILHMIRSFLVQNYLERED